MKIAITADPDLPVPPRLYGGAERLIDMLVRALVDRGHEVTLFAHRDSSVPCELVAYPGESSASRTDALRNTSALARSVVRGRFDVVHSFGRLGYMLPFLPLPIPKLMTYQRPITPASVRWGRRLSAGTLHFSAISRFMTAPVSGLAPWNVVYNGVPLEHYDFVPAVPADAPLAFLGRVEHIKGTHLAIDIAQKAGRKLIIAGNVATEHRAYFDQYVAPRVDGDRVSYVGPVDDARKNQLLGSAAALLMPILWDEPFGLVMAEAMACGTPVIGLRRGAVPEVVEHGVTGFIGNDVDELAAYVPALTKLERLASRTRVERLFSGQVNAEAYLALYRRIGA